MAYYQCKFRAVGGAYTMDKYDLTTDDELDILSTLEEDGWDVLEVYDIKLQ